MDDAFQALVARVLVTDVVTAYAMALDARDWSRFRSLFEDEVLVDYASLGPTHARLPADEWTARCRVLGAFDGTQHKVTNVAVDLAPDAATVTSYVDASHFIAGDDGQVLCGIVHGTYVHHLRRHADGWKIHHCKLIVTGFPGGRAAFDAAFAVARARFAAAQ